MACADRKHAHAGSPARIDKSPAGAPPEFDSKRHAFLPAQPQKVSLPAHRPSLYMTLGRELRIRPEGAVMEKIPLFANESKGGCGGCGSGACGTCAPAPDKPRSTAITRRRLAQTTIFGTAAAVLTGCSEQSQRLPIEVR
jgi:hypothetical protein